MNIIFISGFTLFSCLDIIEQLDHNTELCQYFMKLAGIKRQLEPTQLS